MTTVVNKRKEPCDIDITRQGGPWGNPYRVGIHGTREEVIAMHRKDTLAKRWLFPIIREKMKDKRLGCVCKPLACHGDVYAEIANGVISE